MRQESILSIGVMALSVVFPGGGFAAEGSPTAGPLVRVTAPGFAKKPVVGTLAAIDETRITVQRSKESEKVAIPRDAVTHVEISSKRSRKGKGAGIGALAGLGLGAAIGFAAGEDCESGPVPPDLVGRLGRNLCYSKGETAAGLGVSGALVGALLGAVLAPGEKWESASPERLKMSVVPIFGARGRVGLLVSLTF